ncbi:hypothetical protein [Companilactobacillus muriivasis]|uniref:hypothetical protein n=1 Tax=Companilactobacillus muriivasis TaxID=3081444 RepID=UPI0030C67140
MNLPKEVIESEFPNLKLQSPDGKKIVMTFKNGQSVVIGTEQSDGTYNSEVYEFSDVNDDVVFPKGPEFPDFLAKLSLDKFDGVANSDARDDYNNNVKHVETTVNSLVDYSINQKDYFSKLEDALSDIKGLILKQVDIVVAKYLHDNVETQYYKKSEVDSKFDDINKKLNNIRRRLPNETVIGTFHNPSRSDQMPTNIDINDKVSPEAQAILDKIKNEGGN